jgi:hypothetical protein
MSKNNPNYIQLRKDSTFIYEYRALHLYQQAIGTWQKKDKNLITLNSEIKSTAIPVDVSAINGTNSDNSISVKLNIKGSESLADYKCRVYVNDEIYCLKRCDSLSSILINSPINSIYFMFIKEPRSVTTTYIPLPLVTSKYNPKVKTGNNLEVKVNFNDDYFYYRAFNNDTLKVRGNSIKLFNSSKSRWEKLSKVPNDTKIFSRYADHSTELNLLR